MQLQQAALAGTPGRCRLRPVTNIVDATPPATATELF
jgi:hypothetical protein